MINELTEPLHMPKRKRRGRKAGRQAMRNYTKAETETAAHSRQ